MPTLGSPQEVADFLRDVDQQDRTDPRDYVGAADTIGDVVATRPIGGHT